MSQNDHDTLRHLTPAEVDELHRDQAELAKELGIPPRAAPLTEERVREIVREEIAAATCHREAALPV